MENVTSSLCMWLEQDDKINTNAFLILLSTFQVSEMSLPPKRYRMRSQKDE